MVIEVDNLTKIYDRQPVVDHLTFNSEGKEIIGFLGPNGAGKSTTMKMLTAYLQPSSGSAKVCGYDIMEDPIEVRKNIGYLPESNPLYGEMYVREFLGLTAKIYQLKDIKKTVEETIERVGLTSEANKKIYQLSKGYRQRVGIAQAIMHDPKLLVLDEPTSGLDANQLVEIRNLIKELGKEKTILFSSHIMQEVEMLCDRVVIINNGQLIADEKIQDIKARLKGNKVIKVEFAATNNLLDDYRDLKEGVVVTKGNGHLLFSSATTQDIRPLIFKKAVENNHIILEMFTLERGIEKVFQELTSEI